MVRDLPADLGPAGVGVLVAGAAWLVLARGGRRLRPAAGETRSVVPARTGASARLRLRPAAEAGGPTRRATGEPVRVVVLQVVALLRAGAPPGAAWARAVGVPVTPVGVPDAGALAQVLGLAHARAVVAATRLALDVGAPLGDVLESVAGALANEQEARGEREAALAGPRSTVRVLTWLPAVGALLGWALGADPLSTATDGGIGTASVVLGGAFLAAGRLWTRRLVTLAAGRDREDGLDVQVLLELLAAATRAGSGVPRALQATGAAVGGADGTVLARAADALVLGARWDTAWQGAPARLEPVRQALRGAWVDGAAPSGALRAAGEGARQEGRAATRTAAARLAVRLVLPLGACYLPAFVLVGIVPVLLALGVDLLAG